MLIIFTYKQILTVVVVTLCLLLGCLYLLIRLWDKDRFIKLEERTTSLEYSRDVTLYSDAKGDAKDEVKHG